MKKFYFLFIASILFFACDSKKQTDTSAETSTTTTTDESAGIPPQPVSMGGGGPEAKPIKEYYGFDATGKTKSGFEYVKHVDNKSDILKTGEYAYFRYHIKRRDSVMLSSSEQGLGRMKVPTPEEIAAQPQASPVLEGMMFMGKGDSLSVYFPVKELPRPVPGFENEAYITYSMFLEDIKTEEEHNKLMEVEKKKLEAEGAKLKAREAGIATKVSGIAKDYTSGQLNGKIKTTPSGLKYIIHEQGNGKQAEKGKTVLVQYFGALTDGKMFDNSFKRGQAFNFPLGQGRVIKGWDEGIALLKEGSKATLFIPSEMGYGAAGSPPNIPGGAELIFYVELEKVL